MPRLRSTEDHQDALPPEDPGAPSGAPSGPALSLATPSPTTAAVVYNSAATVSDDVGPRLRVLRSILSGVSTSADASTIAHARTVAAAFASAAAAEAASGEAAEEEARAAFRANCATTPTESAMMMVYATQLPKM